MEDFVPYEIAKKLKEKDFDWETIEVYERNTLACRYEDYPKPTISQALKCLKGGEKLFVLPRINDLGWCYSIHSDLYWDVCGSLLRSSYHAKSYFETYEEAMLAGIEYTLDNLI